MKEKEIMEIGKELGRNEIIMWIYANIKNSGYSWEAEKLFKHLDKLSGFEEEISGGEE